MLMDRYLPHYDVTEVHQIEVEASPEVTYAAIRKADLRDPLISALFAIREWTDRLLKMLRGAAGTPAPAPVTLADLSNPAMGWVLFGESTTEFVVGSVGRFWRHDYGWHPVEAAAFSGFAQPGYAKIAVGFSVRPSGTGGSILRYEARTATTDETARKRFRRYWRVIRPGVAIVMQRALRRIRAHAVGPGLSRRPVRPDPSLDRFMPRYEVREFHQTRVAAPAGVTFAVARELDMQASGLVRAIFRGRELLMGARPESRRRPQPFLTEVMALGWRILEEEPERKLVMGAVARPWEADVRFRGLDPEAFARFRDPGYAKIVWTLEAEPAGEESSIFRTETRVTTTDAESRRRFRHYWMMVSPGVVLIRHAMLRQVRREAQRIARSRAGVAQ